MTSSNLPQTDSLGQETVTVPRAFVEAVRNMRAQQKAFFESRDQTIVGHCKQLERTVDKQLDQIAALTLFS